MPGLTETIALELGAQEPWPNDVKLYQPYAMEQILLPDNANCLSVQAYLHMCGLPFQIEYRANAEHMSPSGKVPFIKCGAFIISELEPIVQFVSNKGISLTTDLGPDEKADMRAYMSLIHTVLMNAELYICWCEHKIYSQVTCVRNGSVYPWPLNYMQNWSKRYQVMQKLKLGGWNKKTLDEIYKEVETCCQALSERLEDREYFFSSGPCEFDALLYAHIVSIYADPQTSMKLTHILSRFPNLLALAHKISIKFMFDRFDLFNDIYTRFLLKDKIIREPSPESLDETDENDLEQNLAFTEHKINSLYNILNSSISDRYDHLQNLNGLHNGDNQTSNFDSNEEVFDKESLNDFRFVFDNETHKEKVTDCLFEKRSLSSNSSSSINTDDIITPVENVFPNNDDMTTQNKVTSFEHKIETQNSNCTDITDFSKSVEQLLDEYEKQNCLEKSELHYDINEDIKTPTTGRKRSRIPVSDNQFHKKHSDPGFRSNDPKSLNPDHLVASDSRIIVKHLFNDANSLEKNVQSKELHEKKSNDSLTEDNSVGCELEWKKSETFIMNPDFLHSDVSMQLD